MVVFGRRERETLGVIRGHVIIPDTIRGMLVTSIGLDAFDDCTLLTSVAIPSSVTSIGEGAFRGCSISLLVKFTVPMRRLFAYQRNDSSNLFRVFDYLVEFLSWQDVARITTVSKCFYSNIIVRCRRDFFYQRCI